MSTGSSTISNEGFVRNPLELPRLDGRSKTTTSQAVAEKLDTHGVVVIESLVPAQDMDQLSQDLRGAAGVFYGAEGSFAGAHTTRNAGKPLGESRIAQNLGEHPLVVDAIWLRLKRWCRRMVLGTCSGINVEPPPDPTVPPAPSQVLHRDEAMWGCTDWPWLPCDENRPEVCVSVMWAISDFTIENGATRVIPGSHRWSRSTTAKKSGLDDLGGEGDANKWALSNNAADLAALERYTIQGTMSKGSVLIWSGGTLHGQSAQLPPSAAGATTTSGTTREGLLFIYNVGWGRSEHNFHWAIPQSILQTFSPKLQELLGIVGSNRVDHSWYSGPVYAQPLLYGSTENDEGKDQKQEQEENDEKKEEEGNI